MYKTLKDFFLNKPWLFLLVYVIAALVATLQEFYGGTKHLEGCEGFYTHYNNYLIFKQSFFHLASASDLYVHYLSEYCDLYKYSPTFALLFGFFAWLPDGLGLFLWNLMNAFALFYGIKMLNLRTREKNIVFLLATVELFTSLQNSQSNALIAGLIILAFALMEKEKFLLACICIALTVYIKLFGLFAFALCLLYRSRWKMIAYSVFSILILAILPLLVIRVDQLKDCYSSWWVLLQNDYVPNYLSLVGVVNAWTGATLKQNWILLFGLILFLIPLGKIKLFDQFKFRLLMLSMILLWVVVFNHKVESPTFIIALAGVGLWFTASGLDQSWRNALAIFALIFTSLSTTDIFPNFIQENLFEPWSVKAVPCVIIYFVSFYELVFRPNRLVDQ